MFKASSCYFFLGLLVFVGSAYAQSDYQLDTVVVSEKQELLSGSHLSSDGYTTVDRKKIDEKKSTTVGQILDLEQGVDVQTSCAFCGSKRITINGLKGEHTNILIDGLPLHSAVSSFYGVDAIPTAAIESIDIYRGAGAYFNTSEAIGGVVNILTADPFLKIRRVSILLGINQAQNLSFGSTSRISDNLAYFVGGQLSNNPNIDIDQNNVTEMPHQKNLSIETKIAYRPTYEQDLSLRVSVGSLQNFGGNRSDLRLSEAVSLTAQSSDFESFDTRKKFIGDEKKITDNIFLNRAETVLSYKNEINNYTIANFKIGRAEQVQDSIYSHGYDYSNRDTLLVSSFGFKFLTEEHTLDLVLDTKNQKMSSDSKVLFTKNNLAKDDFESTSYSLTIQDLWMPSDNLELESALRFSRPKVNWNYLSNQIDDNILSPKIFLKFKHNDLVYSKFGYTTGYRSPLTLFESQHGTDHNGFIVNIRKAEKAATLYYVFSMQRIDDYFNWSVFSTQIENMAYGIDKAALDSATEFVNSDQKYTIVNYDISYGKRVSQNFDFETTFEMFSYPDEYKEKLPVAAIEKRLLSAFNYRTDSVDYIAKVNVFFEQNLSKYYNGNYNIAYTDSDPFSGTFNQTVYKDQKRQQMPTYYTLDLSMQKRISKIWSMNFEVKNVFNYTQTGAGDSPLSWSKHGNHFHLDNMHVWGPLSGRQILLQLLGSF